MQITATNHATISRLGKVSIILISFLLCCQAVAMADEWSTSGLSLGVLKSLTYRGIKDLPVQVLLANGHWEGNPDVPGSAIVPTVNLVDDFVARGDLDGDGWEEAAVLLGYSPEGTGVLVHLAVVAQHQGEVQNLATVSLGDLVQVRDVRFENREVIVDMIAA